MRDPYSKQKGCYCGKECSTYFWHFSWYVAISDLFEDKSFKRYFWMKILHVKRKRSVKKTEILLIICGWLLH